MGTYTFHYIPGPGESGSEVAVRFDDTERYHISDVMAALRQFLLGVTFQPDTIRKYIDIDRIESDQIARL